jgi:hypothetical protein
MIIIILYAGATMIFLYLSIEGTRGILLSIVFMLGSEMKHINKNSNNKYFTVAPVLVAVIITTTAVSPFLIASNMATPAAATTTTTGNATTTTITPSSGGLELSPQPVLRERQISLSQTQ